MVVGRDSNSNPLPAPGITPRAAMMGKKWILSDNLSQTQSQYLKSALYSYFNVQKPLGDTLPLGYHLLYFNPKNEEEALSKDGYDLHQAPEDSTFLRRMWIGGELKFHKPITFNERSFCVESVTKFRKLKDNHFVTIQREILSGDEIAVEETRSLTYMNKPYTALRPIMAKQDPQFSHVMTPTDILLFRYSALTFNAHKIHYDKEYARSEGYPTILMQGPLTVTLLLEWVGTLYDGLNITGFKYKNYAPIFSEQEIQLCLREKEGGVDLWIQDKGGRLFVDGSLTVD